MNIRGRAAGKSKKLPCPGVKLPKMIPSPGVKFLKQYVAFIHKRRRRIEYLFLNDF